MSNFKDNDPVWWQPAGATRPRRARVVRTEGPRYVVQVVDKDGAPDLLWWPKEAEAGDLRAMEREAA